MASAAKQAANTTGSSYWRNINVNIVVGGAIVNVFALSYFSFSRQLRKNEEELKRLEAQASVLCQLERLDCAFAQHREISATAFSSSDFPWFFLRVSPSRLAGVT